MTTRKPIRTDLEDEHRCSSRWGGRRCRLRSGHAGEHDAGEDEGVAIRWGGRQGRKR